MTMFEELKRRGLISQLTHPEEIEKAMNDGPITFYIGFDATADSLHVGHFLQLTVIKRMMEAGHMPIILLGTGTTMVGDPTGRTDMRKMLTIDEINYNADKFLEQMGKVVDIDKLIVARNGDWLLSVGYVELLRDVGVHFSVNKMLTYDNVKTRLEKGLSFIEFNYGIMQSYDFLQLFRKYNCTMQFGGNDQWANIISGVDLVRRVEQKPVYGVTFSLLETSDGQKMGKTQAGAVWLDESKMSVYDFFQYWRNVEDSQTISLMKMLTFVSIEEIEEMEKWEGSELNKAKEILAFEVTKLVHGEKKASEALEASRAVFAGSGISENMPSTSLSDSNFTNSEMNIMDLMLVSGLVASKSDARRLITQNGVSVSLDGENFDSVKDVSFNLSLQTIKDNTVVIKKGKKIYHRITLA